MAVAVEVRESESENENRSQVYNREPAVRGTSGSATFLHSSSRIRLGHCDFSTSKLARSQMSIVASTVL